MKETCWCIVLKPPNNLLPFRLGKSAFSLPVVSVLFRCQLWQITNCYQLGYGPFCNCLSLTGRNCRWREPHVWPSFSHPYRPTPPPPAARPASNHKHSWCLMPCLTGVMIGCVIAVHHCLAGAFLLQSATNTQNRVSNTWISRSMARIKLCTHQAAHKYICIGADIHNHSWERDGAESHLYLLIAFHLTAWLTCKRLFL